MLEEIFASPYRAIGLACIYLFLLYKFSNFSMAITNILGIPYDLMMSSGMEFGATLDFILATLFFYFLCVSLYVLAHGIASMIS